MRVIAGCARGRKLTSLAGTSVRPTADRVKEAVFSMIESRFALSGARVLDLFAGSGALGIEALSRGAGEAVFVDRNSAAARVVRRNLDACGFVARVLPLAATRALVQLRGEGATFDGVFLDPPYAGEDAEESMRVLGEGDLLAPGAWAVVEHDAGRAPAERFGRLGLILTKRYGNTHVSVYRRDG